MGFSNIIKSIKDNVNNALASLGNTNGAVGKWDSGKFGSYTNTPSYTNGDWKASKGYAFKVINIKNNQEADKFKEFELQINPQELQQDEVFAIQVTPTLRGVLVEHQGVLIKDITISGTTGISPKRTAGGSDPKTGKPIMASGHSGFEEFQELRSYFRAYAEAKRIDHSGNLRMLFINKKDNEAIYVEPQKFSMKRSSSKPMHYDYTIILKGLGNYHLDTPKNAQDPTTTAERVDDAINKISYASQVLKGGFDLLQRTERDIASVIITPLNKINDALLNVKNGVDETLQVTRSLVSQLNASCERVKANFNDIIGAHSDSYDRATGRVATLVVSDRTPTYQEHKILNALSNIQKMTTSLLSDQSLFVSNNNQEADVVESLYVERSTAEDGSSVTSNSGLLNLMRPETVDTVNVLGGDTVQTLAARHLGDPDRYREIVILNKLKPPYISDVASSGVLAYGDSVLIPSLNGVGANTGVRMNKDYQITKDLEYAKKSLGVDLQLSDDYDLVFGPNGDLDMIAGIENMAQAILLKMFYENGSLKRHPRIGASLKIGSKSKDLSLVRSNLLASLNADKRIEGVPYLTLRQEGSTTLIVAVIRLTGVSQPVPISVEV